MRHCFHSAADPRCDGFPVPATKPAQSFISAMLYGGPEEDPDKPPVIERHRALICCRCGSIQEIAPANRTTKKLTVWQRVGRAIKPQVRVEPCPVPPSTKAVESLTESKPAAGAN